MTRITLRMPDLELPLTLDTQHPASSSGLGVLVLPDGAILDGERFRGAHARGATIPTEMRPSVWLKPWVCPGRLI